MLISGEYDASISYLRRTNVLPWKCSPLYRAIQLRQPLSIVQIIHEVYPYMEARSNGATTTNTVHFDDIHIQNNNNAGKNNHDLIANDDHVVGDTPLALLYRRFIREEYEADQFFQGDNSRPEVLRHRAKYTALANETWLTIEFLLKHPKNSSDDTMGGYDSDSDSDNTNTGVDNFQSTDENDHDHDHDYDDDDNDNGLIVHAAMRIEQCPPQLCKFLFQKYPQEISRPDPVKGWLPLHVACSAPVSHDLHCRYYSKYVIDTLLKLHPTAAQVLDGHQNFPLRLALDAGRSSLEDGARGVLQAYPDALPTEDAGLISEHPPPAPTTTAGGERRHHGGAAGSEVIFQIQRPQAPPHLLVAAMWAYEDDPAVQMLCCMALRNNAVDGSGHHPSHTPPPPSVHYASRIFLAGGIDAIVNAMDNLPGETAVQENACKILTLLAEAYLQSVLGGGGGSTRRRRRSVRAGDTITDSLGTCLAASGAFRSVVHAMSRHPRDAILQREGCVTLKAMGLACGRNDGGDGSTVALIASVKGVGALERAMEAHPTSVEVQRTACEALSAFLVGHGGGKDYVMDVEKMFYLVHDAKRKFPDECRELADSIIDMLAQCEVVHA